MDWLDAINNLLWHDAVLYGLLAVGVLFTVWSGFGQYRALTHGVAVIRGRYDRPEDPGAINHFQALSAALSATVGLGNIAGVAIAVSLGGPGAVFWMWVTGFVGMALKMTEVTQAMLYRNLEQPDNPHGGAMWVISKGLERLNPALRPVGLGIGGVFCVTLLVSTITGGNMFQAWNVADITKEYFGVPPLLTGVVLMVLTGLVIVGGIKRIGTVAGRLVPFMCLAYLAASGWLLVTGFERIPGLLRMIVVGAFAPQQAQGAFLGGAVGWAFLLGMRRALFSNEAGQGSAPIAHSAARTDEPVREGVVAGLEPFIDTLVVCTMTALVILLSGVWNRGPDVSLDDLQTPAVVSAGQGRWTLEPIEMPVDRVHGWADGTRIFAVVEGGLDTARHSDRHRVPGVVRERGGRLVVEWQEIAGPSRPTLAVAGVYREYKGATLTAKAFDTMMPGLGFVIVPAVAWLFAFSTMISWSYYGEQGAVFLFGPRSVMPYRVLYCVLVLLAASPLISTEAELDTVSSLGTGVMLFANIPIMLLFGRQAMRAFHDYMRRLDRGEFTPGSGRHRQGDRRHRFTGK
jgi:AGCS family alanine or glycine:cation symporter